MDLKPVNSINNDGNTIRVSDGNSPIRLIFKDAKGKVINLYDKIDYFYLTKDDEKFYSVTDISYDGDEVIIRLPKLRKGKYKAEIRDKDGSIYPANEDLYILLRRSFEDDKDIYYFGHREDILNSVEPMVIQHIDKHPNKFKGERGQQGFPGRDGLRGIDGKKGDKGDPGKDGESGIKHRDDVQTINDLPSNDDIDTVRSVIDENTIYIKKKNGWFPFHNVDISKINEVDERLTNQYKSNFLNINERSINAKNPPSPLIGAVGDYYLPDGKINPNATDDTTAIKSLIEFCEENKYNLFFPSSGYLVSETLVGVSNISISGSGINNTEIIKKNGGVNARGIDAVIDFYQKNNFEFKNMRLQGNKKTFAEGGTATTDGLHIQSCSYFDVNNVKGINCKTPFVSQTNWCCTFYRPVGQTSSSYAFSVRNSSTSQVWIQPTAWGTGGEFDIRSSVYLTIISPACDHSDAGGRIDDPFLPNGSGGDYMNPSYIFRISGSNVTIISPGTENSYSKYMYLEGSQVTLLNPYVWKLENYAETYSFIETRGTGRSNLFMTNPDFRNIENKVSPKWDIRGIFIERPDVQNITVNKAIFIDSTFGDYKYVGFSGISFLGAKDLIPNADFILGFSAENSPFLPFNKGDFGDGQQKVVINNGKRSLRFDKGSSLVTSGDDFNMKFRMPLPTKKNQSNLLLNWLGSYSTGGSVKPKAEIRKADNLNSDGLLVHTIDLKDNEINFNTIIQIEKTPSEIFYLEITLTTGLSVVNFDKIEILEI